FHGTFTYSGRNQSSAGRYINYTGDEAAALGDFPVQGFAFSLGGPIQKDKLHFFIAGEFSDRAAPNGGVAIGRDASITLAEVQPIVDYVRSTYGYEPGTIGEVTMKRFSDNLFARLDYQINERTEEHTS